MTYLQYLYRNNRGSSHHPKQQTLINFFFCHSVWSDLSKSVRYMCADTTAHQLRRYDLPLLLVLPKMIKL